jgi:HEPN domain-containing protein
MKKSELINYWLDGSICDFKTISNLIKSKDYHWALFIGHLVIEKILKAIYVKKIDSTPPKIHNLVSLASKCELILDEKIIDNLDIITTFNIATRYPDIKNNFYQKCDKEYAEKNIKIITEVRECLLKMI